MSNIRFLLAGNKRYPVYITGIVHELLEEADKCQIIAQQFAAKRRDRHWHALAIRAASLRVEAQMLAAQSEIDFNVVARTYIRKKLRRERRRMTA